MSIYLLEYGWGAGSPESSVIIANSEEEAEKIATKEVDGKMVRVNRNPKNRGDSNYGHTEYTIKEISFKIGVIYTGYYCC